MNRVPRAPLSLRWRLLLATAVAVVLAALAAGWALSTLFRDHVQRQFADSLVAQLDQVTARLDLDAQGQPAVDTAGLSDPRWSRPYSGLYWQLDRVERSGIHRAVLRSRSLWDTELSAPPDALVDNQVHQHTIAGPGAATLLAVERTVRLGGDDAATWRVLVAGDTAAMRAAIDAFDRVLALSLLGLTLLLVAAAVAQVAIGLAPLRGLRASLQGLHAGRSARLEGRFPAEVQPLVDDFNAVLQRREVVVERSRTQAGDLAHAIKTPLAVMSQVAQAGRDESAPSTRLLARTVAEQVELARRQVDRHLARARAAGGLGMPGMRTELGPVVDALLEVMRRLYAERKLRLDARIPARLAASSERQDAQEMIGNLLDNACKWARSQVRVSATAGDPAARTVAIVVDDDGPGIDAPSRERALERGARLDETVPGSGLGLAIVRDLAALYEGSLALDASPLGGLRATLVLPRGGG
ncbi:MAG: Adaptive-response sensory-kinase SasA [Burkholderiaceae bacterium]|nr:Adaptive-response sensory-kinase SasA [Burkholderiaceae bacterium]